MQVATNRSGSLMFLSKDTEKCGYVICECLRCGRVRSMNRSNFNVAKSCGCLRPQQPLGKHNTRWKGCGKLSSSMFRKYVRGALKRNLPFLITIEYAWEVFQLQNGKCALTGEELTFPMTRNELRKNLGNASMDRIDSLRGYEIGNIQWVTKEINIMKKDFAQERIVEIALAVHQRENVVTIQRGIPIANDTQPSDSSFGLDIIGEPDQQHYVMAKCRLCGSIKRTYKYNIAKVKSCGCWRRRLGGMSSNWRGVGQIHGTVISRYRASAVLRDLPFALSADGCWRLFQQQDGKCGFTGWEIAFATNQNGIQHGEATASLDRIDSKIGYFESNVMWVHKDVNLLKCDMPNQYFISLCSKIATNFKQLPI